MTPKPAKRSKSKPFNFDTFFQENYGDIYVSLIIVILTAALFDKTLPYASVFFLMQGNTTVTIENYDYLMYTPAQTDLLTIFFYALAWASVRSLLESLDTNIIKGWKLGKLRHFNAHESVMHFLFYISLFLYALQVSQTAGILLRWTGATLPSEIMTHGVKTVFIFQLSFWMSTFLVMPVFSPATTSQANNHVATCFIRFVASYATYLSGFPRLALLLLILDAATGAIYHFATVIKSASDRSEIAEHAFKLYSFIFVLSRAVILTMISYSIWFAENEGDSFDLVLRYVKGGVLCVAVLLQFIRFLRPEPTTVAPVTVNKDKKE